jgi:hypothetical protein
MNQPNGSLNSIHATNMSTSINKPEFILFFRDTNWDKGLSPEETQKALSQFMNWMEELSQQGIFKAGQPLETHGKVVSGKKGKNVADGPYAESKEAVGGYFLLQADDFDEAVEIAQGCPLLEYGSTVEVRQVAEVCPTVRRVNQKMALANA